MPITFGNADTVSKLYLISFGSFFSSPPSTSAFLKLQVPILFPRLLNIRLNMLKRPKIWCFSSFSFLIVVIRLAYLLLLL